MISAALDDAARALLESYPLGGVRAVHALGNHGGFSGARLWRVEALSGSFCLRAWPPTFTSERLARIHALLVRLGEAGLAYIPRLLVGCGDTWTLHVGRLWELTTWMPGRAAFHEHPTETRLRAACEALAQVHEVWAREATPRGPCPGIQRRLTVCAEFQQLVRTGWRLPAPLLEPDPVRPWAERAWRVVLPRLDTIPGKLAPWLDRELSLHPCLCDVWHDHLLFVAERLTGLIDFGAIKLDHASVDLARLLGSLVGDDVARWRIGLDAYAAIRPLGEEEIALAHALDETGLLLGAATWLRWVYRENKEFSDRHLVARHLAGLVQRLESWEKGALSFAL